MALEVMFPDECGARIADILGDVEDRNDEEDRKEEIGDRK